MALAVAALGLTGCGVGDESVLPGVDQSRPAGEEDTIRAWSAALNREDYEKAASYFAAGAIVEQVGETKLSGREAAIAFNRSLPCKADVTDVDDEGETVIAAFRLRGGPEGGCEGGTARVRFLFRDGKFAEWRQLPEPPPLGGEAAQAGSALQS